MSADNTPSSIHRAETSVILLLLCSISTAVLAAERWSAKLDRELRFYHSTERSIRMGAPDDRFLSDEEANLLCVSQDNRLFAHALNDRE
jgi:hypothetical protein